MAVGRRLRAIFGDQILAGTVIALSLFGIAMIYSAGQLDAPKPGVAGAWRLQVMWLGVSIVGLAIVMRIPVRWLEWFAVPAYILAIIALAATLVIGTGRGTAEGTKSWLVIGPMQVQPSQFANLATILMLGRIMGSWREAPVSLFSLWQPILVVAIPMGLVFLQPDLGTAMVFAGMLVAALYWAGTPLAVLFMMVSPLLGLLTAIQAWVYSVYILGLVAFLYFYRAYLWEAVLVVGLSLTAGAIANPLWNSLDEYQQNRLLVFLDPSKDPRGAGYNVRQSRVAIGSGGLIGKGFTEGTQKRLAFLPEQHTDFIFAVIAEEMGFIFGTLIVLGAYGVILWRLIRLAERIPDPFAGIVVFSIFGAWFTHIMVNIGMTVGIMPVTGIPLPFLSYGGSFLLATYIALGMAQRVASEQGRI
ncbi:MAG TPA: rod shape-determining protein RodA [Longimicrobiales bacterium]|nr:rod shape-determining protein RodA [Longimicrobiales bacterium]